MYTPDRWVVIKITDTKKNKSHRRVFAGWYGGYAGSDSWKMNSGITFEKDQGDYVDFGGESGSVYRCHKAGYGMSGYMSHVLASIIENHNGKMTIEVTGEYDDE